MAATKNTTVERCPCGTGFFGEGAIFLEVGVAGPTELLGSRECGLRPTAPRSRPSAPAVTLAVPYRRAELGPVCAIQRWWKAASITSVRCSADSVPLGSRLGPCPSPNDRHRGAHRGSGPHVRPASCRLWAPPRFG